MGTLRFWMVEDNSCKAVVSLLNLLLLLLTAEQCIDSVCVHVCVYVCVCVCVSLSLSLSFCLCLCLSLFLSLSLSVSLFLSLSLSLSIPPLPTLSLSPSIPLPPPPPYLYILFSHPPLYLPFACCLSPPPPPPLLPHPLSLSLPLYMEFLTQQTFCFSPTIMARDKMPVMALLVSLDSKLSFADFSLEMQPELITLCYPLMARLMLHLLMGAPSFVIQPVQKVQNSVARLSCTSSSPLYIPPAKAAVDSHYRMHWVQRCMPACFFKFYILKVQWYKHRMYGFHSFFPFLVLAFGTPSLFISGAA